MNLPFISLQKEKMIEHSNRLLLIQMKPSHLQELVWFLSLPWMIYLYRGDQIGTISHFNSVYNEGDTNGSVLPPFISPSILFLLSVSRRVVLLAITLNATVSFSGQSDLPYSSPSIPFFSLGIIAMSFFGTFLLSQLGFSDRSAALSNCLSSLAGTAGAITATLAVDKVNYTSFWPHTNLSQVGRRLLVIGSLLLLALINTLMMVCTTVLIDNQGHSQVLELLYEATNWMGLGHAFLLIFIAFLFIFRSSLSSS